MTADMMPAELAAPTRGRRSAQLGVWLWVVAALGAAALLAVAIVGREHGDVPTLRPMEASESMSDAQARAVAESTVLLWLREQNAGHRANLSVLTSPDHADHVMKLMQGQSGVRAFGGFTRVGSEWGLSTHLISGSSAVFVLKQQDGELRLFQLRSAPIP